jgi:ribosomal protein L30/L7E
MNIWDSIKVLNLRKKNQLSYIFKHSFPILELVEYPSKHHDTLATIQLKTMKQKVIVGREIHCKYHAFVPLTFLSSLNASMGVYAIH